MSKKHFQEGSAKPQIPLGKAFHHHEGVILSGAPRRSIAQRTAYGAESKDPGDACWQMFF
jgi:hypothetical protein